MTEPAPPPISEILRAKIEDGRDCTADESAEIKAFFDRQDASALHGLAWRVAEAFPCEVDEWQEDVDNGIRAQGSALDPDRDVIL